MRLVLVIRTPEVEAHLEVGVTMVAVVDMAARRTKAEEVHTIMVEVSRMAVVEATVHNSSTVDTLLKVPRVVMAEPRRVVAVLLIRIMATAILDRIMVAAAELTEELLRRTGEELLKVTEVAAETTSRILLPIKADTINNKAVINHSNHLALLSSKDTEDQRRMDRRLNQVTRLPRQALDGSKPLLLMDKLTITTNQRAPRNGTNLLVLRKQLVHVCSRVFARVWSVVVVFAMEFVFEPVQPVCRVIMCFSLLIVI